jgi:CRISPR-associated RAMP protein (TIGR02581 family)
MLKKNCNEIRIDLTIRPDGPVLIKSGSVGLGTDMAFVLTHRNGREEVYLPGTSLKGVIRSHCEKICRTLAEASTCQVFDSNNDNTTKYMSCNGIIKDRKISSETAYKVACPACRMFGYLKFKGRCFIDDAYAVGEPPRPHVRDGVGIDRFKGSAARGAKYDFEVITDGEFSTSLFLRNFELWQLDLIVMAINDLINGEIRIGMGTARGLGHIKADVKSVRYTLFGKQTSAMEIYGIEMLDASEADRYGFFKHPDNRRIPLPEDSAWTTVGIRHQVYLPPAYFLGDLAKNLQGLLFMYLESNPSREEMKKLRPQNQWGGGRR